MTMPAPYRAWYFGSTALYAIPDDGGSGDSLTIGGTAGSEIVPGFRRDAREFLTISNTIEGATSYFNFIDTDFAIRGVAMINSGVFTIAHKHDGFKFHLDSSGNLLFSFYHRGTSSITTISTTGINFADSKFHDFVAIKKDAALQIVVDGALLVSDSLIVNESINDDGAFNSSDNIINGRFESLEIWRDYSGDALPSITDFADDFYSTSTMVLRNIYPSNGEANVNIGLPIDFWIDDAINDVVTNTLDVAINGDAAIINGVAQTGYFVTLTNTPGSGLYVEIQLSLSLKAKNWWNDQLTVDIYVENDASNILSESFIFYAADDTEAPYIQNRDPASATRFVSLDKQVYFELADDLSGVDINSVVIEVDKAGLHNFEVAFSGGVFHNGYTGSVTTDVTVLEQLYECTIIPPIDWPVAAPVYFRITCRDFLENEYVIRYWFKTALQDTDIKLVTPQNGEQLVSVDTSIVLDFGVDPTTMYVDNVLVYDHNDTPAFKNSWSGVYLNDINGRRLILDPPTPFARGALVKVDANTVTTTVTFLFLVTTAQITNDNDAKQPKISKISTEIWLARIKDLTGKLQLRKGDPPGSETEVIPAQSVDIGYDSTLGKFVLLYTADGKVYYTTADPADLPEVLPEPSTVTADIINSPAESGYASYPATTFMPVKRAFEDQEIQSFREGYSYGLPVLLTTPTTPHVVSAPPEFSTVTIHMYTSTSLPANFVGFDLLRFNPETGIFEYIAFIPGTNDGSVLVYEDNVYLVSCFYYVFPVFDMGNINVRGSNKSAAAQPPTQSTLIKVVVSGSGYMYDIVGAPFRTNVYAPVKKSFEDEEISSTDSGFALYSWTGFGLIGVG